MKYKSTLKEISENYKTVEALQFKGTPESALEIFEVFPIEGGKFLPNFSDLNKGELLIPTNSGDEIVLKGDYVLKLKDGTYETNYGKTFESVWEKLENV